MGSGGRSGWFGDLSAEKLRDQLRKAEDSVRDAEFEAKVAQFLADCLVDYNARDTEVIRSILDKVKDELGDEFEFPLELRFGGSVSKNTFVNGLSDVDALVLLKEQDIQQRSPSEIRAAFADRLRSRFGREAVAEGKLAVTLKVFGQEVQLLPAVAEGDHVKISTHDGKGWSTIRPRAFSDQLTKANQRLDHKLVPMIKLAKSMLSALPEPRQLSGYHIEVLAVDIFNNYQGSKTHKDMLRHFFDHLPAAVRQPRRDSTGQSYYLDDYLGARDDVRRNVVADATDRIARRIRNADGAKSLDRWRELLFTE